MWYTALNVTGLGGVVERIFRGVIGSTFMSLPTG